LPRTVETNSRAIPHSVSSPSIFTALSLRLERVVEGELVLGKPERLAPGVGLARLAGQRDQLLDHLGGLEGSVLVSADERKHQVLASGALGCYDLS